MKLIRESCSVTYTLQKRGKEKDRLHKKNFKENLNNLPNSLILTVRIGNVIKSL